MRVTEDQYEQLLATGRRAAKRVFAAAKAERAAAEIPIAGKIKTATPFFRAIVGIPPSLNNAYSNVSSVGRVLSKEAKVYKRRTIGVISNYALVSRFACPPKARLALSLRLHFASNHRRDISNCCKLVEDCLAKVLGFDDSRVDRLLVERGDVDPQNPRCEILLGVI